jgi:hypothetical protein
MAQILGVTQTRIAGMRSLGSMVLSLSHSACGWLRAGALADRGWKTLTNWWT